MHENRYGAQSTTQNANVKNHLIGIGFARFEQPINSFSIAQHWPDQEVNKKTVITSIQEVMQQAYKEQFIDGEGVASWIEGLWEDDKSLNDLYQKAQKDCETYLRNIKILKK